MPRVHAATMSSPLSPPGTVGNCVAANTETHSDATAAASRRSADASIFLQLWRELKCR